MRLNTLQRKLGATELFYEKYTYADNGNQLTRRKRSLGTPAQTLSYTYDSADQLLSVSNPKDASNYPQSYAYDPAGNLSTSGAPAGSRTFSYNSPNERTTDAGIAQQFDANGNLSTGMGFTLAWDAEDRVKSISYNGTQKRVEYDYDGLGRRVRIRSMDNGVKTAEYLYVWDGLKLCEKRDSAVDTFPVSIYFPQGERKFLSGTYINYFYLRDRLGSVRGATSDAGSIIQNADYLPYGPSSPQQPAVTDPDFGFTGHLKCPFTGLTLAPYRILSYANWLSRDPFEEAGGLNLYGYVANNPVNLVDPDGLAAIYTDQASGVTYFNPNPEMPGPISSWPSRSDVLPSSKPGADGPYESADFYPAEGPRNNKPRAYGPNDLLLTDDPRYRWLHGGGSDLPNPLAPRQGWYPTHGCTRMQNEDIQDLVNKVRDFRRNNPGIKIPYSRSRPPVGDFGRGFGSAFASVS